MVARQHHHEVRAVALDDVDILVHGIGGADVPHGLGHALRGGQDVEALVALRPEEVPSPLKVADEAVGLVLRGDRDTPNAGVQRIRERKVDDARVTAEIEGGLRPSIRKFEEASSATPGEHVRHGVSGIGRREPHLLRRSRSEHANPTSLPGGVCAGDGPRPAGGAYWWLTSLRLMALSESVSSRSRDGDESWPTKKSPSRYTW